MNKSEVYFGIANRAYIRAISMAAGVACFAGGIGIYSESYRHTPTPKAEVLIEIKEMRVKTLKELVASPDYMDEDDTKRKTAGNVLGLINRIEQYQEYQEEMQIQADLADKRLKGEMLMVAGGAIILGAVLTRKNSN